MLRSSASAGAWPPDAGYTFEPPTTSRRPCPPPGIPLSLRWLSFRSLSCRSRADPARCDADFRVPVPVPLFDRFAVRLCVRLCVRDDDLPRCVCFLFAMLHLLRDEYRLPEPAVLHAHRTSLHDACWEAREAGGAMREAGRATTPSADIRTCDNFLRLPWTTVASPPHPASRIPHPASRIPHPASRIPCP